MFASFFSCKVTNFYAINNNLHRRFIFNNQEIFTISFHVHHGATSATFPTSTQHQTNRIPLTFINTKIIVRHYFLLKFALQSSNSIAGTIEISTEISNAHSFRIYVSLRARVLPRCINHTTYEGSTRIIYPTTPFFQPSGHRQDICRRLFHFIPAPLRRAGALSYTCLCGRLLHP